ncbi:MAG TPA: hypothetical protein VI522_00100 [Gammaproteobacteria bacterium]|nr:hypothetical protein [Gammaproteobacteria bacterium]
MILLIAFIWSFLEATVFFIIPDVSLSLVGIKNLKKALIACVVAAFAAVLGGALLYGLSLQHFTIISDFFNHIPGINPALQQTVAQQLQSMGLWALFIGPLEGLPYKIYSLYAHSVHLSFINFLWVSFIARLLRFIAVTLLVHGIAKLLLMKCSQHTVFAITLVGWIIFYVFYFVSMS